MMIPFMLGLALLCGSSVAQFTFGGGGADFGDTILALNNKPVLKFDGDASSYCYPNHPQYNGQSNCQTTLDTNAPIYWHAANGGYFRKQICYWHFYAWQRECFGNEGDHAEDWERVCVNFARSGSTFVAKSYTFYQHNGWYTRCNIEKYQGRPVVYVGKIAHGSYHKGCDGVGFLWEIGYCQGACGYWDDFRNPGQTWYLSNSNMKYYTEGFGEGWNKPNSPNNADRRSFNDQSCAGSSDRLLTTSGCWQNEVGGLCSMF